MIIKECLDIKVGRAIVFWSKRWNAWILPGRKFTTNKALATRIARRMNVMMTPEYQRPSSL